MIYQSCNLSFGFSRIENRGDREIDFVKKSDGNSQCPLPEDFFAKDAHEILYFQVDKPKTQVSTSTKVLFFVHFDLCFLIHPLGPTAVFRLNGRIS